MKNLTWISGVFLSLSLIGCHSADRHFSTASDASPNAVAQDDDGGEEEIALDHVPAAVKQAAVAAVPGLVLREAEKEIEGGVTVYALEGRVGSDEYEVEVSSDGRVLEIDKNGDDDDDDDD